MNIAFVDLKRQNQVLLGQLTKVFEHTISTATFIDGEPVVEFEEQFASFCDTHFCIGVNSGTDALFFPLLAYGIGPGDEVVTAPNSYFSTAAVIEHTGAKVVFADIDPVTYTIDPSEVKKKITSRTKAIMPVHLCGQPADMDPLVHMARKYNLVIIEDCCQAHGAKYKNKTVPYTETGAFSFYPGKNLGSFGDGGAVVTANRIVAKKVRLLRNDGSLKKYIHQLFGYKSRLDTLQATILMTKLRYLGKWNGKRREHARTYAQLLSGVEGITTPKEVDYAHHVYHLYVIETTYRDALQKYLKAQGISTVIHYPIPIHLQAPYRKLGYQPGDFPVTEAKTEQVLSLPMFPELTRSEIHWVAKQVKRFMGRQKFAAFEP